MTLGLQLLDTGGKRFNLHDHATPPAIGIIVHTFVLIVGIITKVMYNNFTKVFFLGPLQNGMRKGTIQQIWQYRNDVKPHNAKIVFFGGEWRINKCPTVRKPWGIPFIILLP